MLNNKIINQPLTPKGGVDIFAYYDSLPNDTFAQRDFGSHTNAPLEAQGFFSFYKANSNYGHVIYMPISLNVEYTISKSQGQWGEWEARAKKDDLADRTTLWSGSLELTAQYQNINISSAANYNQIIVVIKNGSTNITGDIVIDRHFFNVETNINRYIYDTSTYTGVNIIPQLSNFQVRLIGETNGTWVLTQVIGKM